jgi:hypothetical protein
MIAEAPALVDGFSIVKIGRDDPAIQERVSAFLRRYRLPANTPALGHDWWGLMKDDVLCLVIGVVPRSDQSLEVTDFYPAPTKDGMKAAVLAGEFLKSLVDSGKIKYFVGAVLPQNRWMQKHYAEFFGSGPKCLIYCYGGQ